VQPYKVTEDLDELVFCLITIVQLHSYLLLAYIMHCKIKTEVHRTLLMHLTKCLHYWQYNFVCHAQLPFFRNVEPSVLSHCWQAYTVNGTRYVNHSVPTNPLRKVCLWRHF